MRDHFAAFRKQRQAPAQSAPEAANSNHDPDELEERAAMAVEGGVPALYIDAFARMQVVHPILLAREEWARTVGDAGRFLDAWGEAAVGLGWSPDDLFGGGGLIAALKGSAVTALCSLDQRSGQTMDALSVSRNTAFRRHPKEAVTTPAASPLAAGRTRHKDQ